MNNSKINVERIKELLPDYITGALSPEDALDVEEAINSFPQLKELYLDMKNALDIAGSVQAEEPLPQYWDTLLPRIHEKIDAKANRSALYYAWRVLVPAAAVVLIFIIYRISFTPETQISKEELNKIKNEKIEAKDTVEKKIQIPVQTEQNIVKQGTVRVKPHYMKRIENTHNEESIVTRIEQKESDEHEQTLIKELQSGDDIASAADVDEYSIFGAGVPGTLDEETDNELDKLNSNEQKDLLESLSNSNL